MKPVKNKLSVLGILVLTGAFLLLGFCPLRNVLVRLAQPEPARRTQPVPDYAKITSGKECLTFTVTRQPVPTMLAPVAAFYLDIQPIAIVCAAPQRLIADFVPTLPLYLRNRAVLI